MLAAFLTPIHTRIQCNPDSIFITLNITNYLDKGYHIFFSLFLTCPIWTFLLVACNISLGFHSPTHCQWFSTFCSRHTQHWCSPGLHVSVLLHLFLREPPSFTQGFKIIHVLLNHVSIPHVSPELWTSKTISYWMSPFGSPQTMCPKLNPSSFSCQICFSSRVPHTINCPETWALWLHSSYLINPQLLHVLPFTCSRECSWICLYFSILTATTLVQATFPYDTHYYCSLLTSQPCLKLCSP